MPTVAMNVPTLDRPGLRLSGAMSGVLFPDEVCGCNLWVSGCGTQFAGTPSCACGRTEALGFSMIPLCPL